MPREIPRAPLLPASKVDRRRFCLGSGCTLRSRMSLRLPGRPGMTPLCQRCIAKVLGAIDSYFKHEWQRVRARERLGLLPRMP